MPRTTKKGCKGTKKEIEKKNTKNQEETKEDKKPKKQHRPQAFTVKKTSAKKTTKKGKGKKPLTPYFLFTQEKREEVKKTLQEGEQINKKLSAMWNAMTEEEQQVYKDRYKEQVEAIKEEQEKVNQNRREKLAASRAAAKEKKEE